MLGSCPVVTSYVWALLLVISKGCNPGQSPTLTTTVSRQDPLGSTLSSLKFLEPIGHFRSDKADNGWGMVVERVAMHCLPAHHYNLLIDKAAIHEVADVVRNALCCIEK